MDTMDYRAWQFWWSVLQTSATFFIAVYVWLVNRSRVNAARVVALEGQLDGYRRETATRLAEIETHIEHLPHDQHVARIHQRIDQLGQGLKRMEGELCQIDSGLKLIHQHLLEQRR